MARPPKRARDRQTVPILIRLTPSEKLAVQSAAERMGLPLATFVRSAAVRAAAAAMIVMVLLALGCGGTPFTVADTSPPVADAGHAVEEIVPSGDAGGLAETTNEIDAHDAAPQAESGVLSSSSSGGSSGGNGSSSGTSSSGSSSSSSGGSSGARLSCAPGGAGMTNCGAASENCCTSLEVPGGTYNRTYTNSGSGPTGEADVATVSGFRLDKYLVTVARFRQFVSAWNVGSGWTPPPASGKHTHLNGGSGLTATGGGYEPGWVTSNNSNIAPTTSNLACDATYATWTSSAGSQENLPINCVNWYEAYSFCIWDGGFLPSEAEWEYAAAGGSHQRQYPWGAATPGTTNTYAVYGCYYPSGSGSCTTVENIAPVGVAALGAGLWGQLDLAGGMDEWNMDWYAPYAPCSDCANLTPSANGRVIRGGDSADTTTRLLPPTRNSFTADRHSGIGMRCARVQ